jgi:hypothetical protein
MIYDAELSQYETRIYDKKTNTRASDPFFDRIYKENKVNTGFGYKENKYIFTTN